MWWDLLHANQCLLQLEEDLKDFLSHSLLATVYCWHTSTCKIGYPISKLLLLTFTFTINYPRLNRSKDWFKKELHPWANNVLLKSTKDFFCDILYCLFHLGSVNDQKSEVMKRSMNESEQFYMAGSLSIFFLLYLISTFTRNNSVQTNSNSWHLTKENHQTKRVYQSYRDSIMFKKDIYSFTRETYLQKVVTEISYKFIRKKLSKDQLTSYLHQE